MRYCFILSNFRVRYLKTVTLYRKRPPFAVASRWLYHSIELHPKNAEIFMIEDIMVSERILSKNMISRNTIYKRNIVYRMCLNYRNDLCQLSIQCLCTSRNLIKLRLSFLLLYIVLKRWRLT